MLVFWKERLVFLAVPKTGTSAYAEALAPRASIVISDPPELKHAPVYRYNRFIRPMLAAMGAEEVDLIAVMREPVSWLGSWYRYRQRPFLHGKPVSTAGISFDAFVQAYCSDTPPAFAQVGSQAKFLEPRPNGVALSRIFPYHRPDAVNQFLSDRLGHAIDVPRRNVSPAADTTLSASVRARLERYAEADFALWASVSSSS